MFVLKTLIFSFFYSKPHFRSVQDRLVDQGFLDHFDRLSFFSMQEVVGVDPKKDTAVDRSPQHTVLRLCIQGDILPHL